MTCRFGLLRTRTPPGTLRLLLTRTQLGNTFRPRQCTVACPELRPGKRIQADMGFLPPSCRRRIPTRRSFPGRRCSQHTEGTLKLSCMCAETCRLRSLHHTSRRARIRRSAYTFLARTLRMSKSQCRSRCLLRTAACPGLRPGKRIRAGMRFLPPSCRRRIPPYSNFPGQLYSQYTAVPLNLSCIRSGVCQLCSLARTSRRARIRRWSCTCLADM